MKFYRVHLRSSEDDASKGFEFYTNKQEVDRRYINAGLEGLRVCSVKTVDVEPSKVGILKALREFAGHPDNGE